MKCNTYKCYLILLILSKGDSNQIHSENSLIKRILCENLLVLNLIIKSFLINTSNAYVKHYKTKKTNAKLKDPLSTRIHVLYSFYIFQFCFLSMYFVDTEYHTYWIFIFVLLGYWEANQVNVKYTLNKK